jgi:hypothetical protein
VDALRTLVDSRLAVIMLERQRAHALADVLFLTEPLPSLRWDDPEVTP